MNKKPEAIVFFDLDGTLFNSQIDVLSSSLEAIKKLKQNNITPIIATGRTPCEVFDLMKKTKIDSIIGMNGQVVLYKGEKVFTNDIDTEVIDRLYQYSKQQTGIALSFYNYEMMRVSQDSQSTQKFYHFIKEQVPPVDDQIYLKSPVQMLLLLCESGEELYQDVFPELTFIRNTPYCVDVFNRGGSKGYGITQLLQNKGFTDVPTYAFGDGMNDFEMFLTVDHPIAMGNAVDELKEKAEFVTDTNDNDGIAKALQKFGLI
ncbi:MULTISPECIES: Cof-type HAD-IIB family hydrolase [unclassified Gilliamella]|uniref:Cof-type HAD-IIB family hydrolase n=1 Tax=unclassified Gilliamella TaxID=2685620 RepID=UPI001306402B|nr:MULTISPECIES: Cof-type HAD-IIB family hydrolase [unclassified Gilliamella]MWP49789.1 Cof-type HAD-IIB family hydrolase [Gilliamella sp. Lep-s35]MWP69504.1 Cof-type HAD-IIB family hydrolase [Gilliamella sp. Lep-s5]MWP77768.1 Cof-type HAD-IIB family hydrolase [Gilliamella sp. Lep-s21]